MAPRGEMGDGEREEEEDNSCVSEFLKLIESSDEEGEGEGEMGGQKVQTKTRDIQPARAAVDASYTHASSSSRGGRENFPAMSTPHAYASVYGRTAQTRPVYFRKTAAVARDGAGSDEDEPEPQKDAGELNLAAIRAISKDERDPGELTSILQETYSEVGHMQRRELGGGLDGCVVDGVLSVSECAALREATERMGFSFWNPSCDRRDFRNADTVEVTNVEFANRIWTRIKPFVPEEVVISEGDSRYSKELGGRWVASSLNSNMLFNRYGPGGHFSPHTDGYTILDFNTRSMYSCLIYLNECEVGGCTRMMEESGDALTGHTQETFVKDSEGRHRFPDARIRDAVSPMPGRALMFFQDTLHEGEPVGPGCAKYMIRTDVIYTRQPAICDGDNDRRAYRMFREAELMEHEQPDKATELYRLCSRLSPALADVLGL